jgi:hypothetical protein
MRGYLIDTRTILLVVYGALASLVNSAASVLTTLPRNRVRMPTR